MPSNETLERFIARVEQNAHAEAIEEFYAGSCHADMVSLADVRTMARYNEWMNERLYECRAQLSGPSS